MPASAPSSPWSIKSELMRLSLSDRLRQLDPIIVGVSFGFLILGLAVLTSATAAVAVQRTGDSLYLVKRQLMLGVLPGSFLFVFLALVDYRIWKRYAFFILVGAFVLLLLVYVPGVGERVGGSLSWITIAGLRFQPSELVKLGFLIYLAAWFSSRSQTLLRDWRESLVPFVGTLGAIVLLLVIQPDTGSMTVIAGTAVLLYLVAGAPITWFVGMVSVGAGLLWILIKTSPYRAARFMTFLRPELDPKGIGYHINQAILAVASGGWLGLGYGKSRQKYLYLPEVEADSIFAVMAEEMGFVITLLILCAYGVLVWRCFVIARRSKDRFGAYLAAGIGMWVALQVGLNVGSMIGILPITGVTLPFISHGGTSLAVMLASVGLVAGIPKRM
ncbi:MAG: putative lipid II flippase FtsW [Candidatus Uhrbacteria bacterium]|nr:putative lipid II flippase FtsW [Candidatus Uhrbacteria bacterium]